MEPEKQPKRKITHRTWILVAAALVAVLSLLIEGVHRAVPAFPGWEDLYRMAGLSPDDAHRQSGFLFVNVGQGDCTLILGERVNVLVDVGSSDEFYRVEKVLEEYSIERLDAVIFTHAHEDHMGGGAKLLEHCSVGEFYLPEWIPKEEIDRTDYDEFMSCVETENITLHRLSESVELQMEELSLSLYLSPSKLKDENERGLAVRAELPNRSALITGDFGESTEFDLMEAGFRVDCDILRVGHHGAKNSTCAAFLRRAKPQYAVISVGDNRYGHPDPSVTDRLSNAGVTYYRTDLCGSVFFEDSSAPPRWDES